MFTTRCAPCSHYHLRLVNSKYSNSNESVKKKFSSGAIVTRNDMLLNMTSSSDESLRELPKPYDISSAVTRALRIDSSSGVSEVNARRTSHVNLLTGNETPISSNSLMPRRHQSSSCDYQSAHIEIHYYNDLPLQMELEIADKTISAICDTFEEPSSSASNMAELDHFYKFLDTSAELEDLVPSPKKIPLPRLTRINSYPTSTIPSSCLTTLEPSTRRRKSKRSLSYYDDSSPEHSPVNVPRPCSQPRNFNWDASLVDPELWRRFDEVGTEMVITKTGRRMFPTLNMNITGLEHNMLYSIKLNIAPANSKRYKYISSKWVPTGRAEKKVNYCEYIHPDSPNSGGYWMEKGLSFKHLKLTNNKNTKYDDQIILNSMQKYQPILTVTSERDGVCQKFYFPDTQFIAVTAYQNNQITQMKIDHNPYAKAFRECAESNQKGGHCVRRASHSSRSLSPTHTSEASETSVESGVESENTHAQNPPADLFSDDTVDIVSQPNPFSTSSLNYWADENSLWNPNFISPPPPFDSATDSFSEPYLQQTSRTMAQNDISPVKGLCGELDSTVIVDIESIDDDDVFL